MAQSAPATSARPLVPTGSVIVPLLLGVVLALLGGRLLLIPAFLVLWGIWWLFARTAEEIVLAAALSFQWLQVTAGILWQALGGAPSAWEFEAAADSAVQVGLLAVSTLALGLKLGSAWLPARRPPWPVDAQSTGSLRLLLILWAAFLLGGETLAGLFWRAGPFAQPLLALLLLRLVFLYAIAARLSRARKGVVVLVLVLGLEVAAGFVGFFGSFREALVLPFLGILGAWPARRSRALGLAVAFVGLSLLAGWIWTGIKSDVRLDFSTQETPADRLRRVERLGQAFLSQPISARIESVEPLVDRLWQVEMCARAMQRVPRILPHEGGELFQRAVEHVLYPRWFFPHKADPPHPSDLVRRYAGVWVAGEESGTSIAFGYAAESYVDFGVPLCFVPIFAFGLFCGLLFGLLRRSIRDPLLRAAALSAIFWSALYLYERSWARLLGLTLTWAVLLGVAVLILERLCPPPREAT